MQPESEGLSPQIYKWEIDPPIARFRHLNSRGPVRFPVLRFRRSRLGIRLSFVDLPCLTSYACRTPVSYPLNDYSIIRYILRGLNINDVLIRISQ